MEKVVKLLMDVTFDLVDQVIFLIKPKNTAQFHGFLFQMFLREMLTVCECFHCNTHLFGRHIGTMKTVLM